MQEPRAKAALIWMLGEYGEHVDDAPYTLEAFAESWDEDSTPEVCPGQNVAHVLLVDVHQHYVDEHA